MQIEKGEEDISEQLQIHACGDGSDTMLYAGRAAPRSYQGQWMVLELLVSRWVGRSNELETHEAVVNREGSIVMQMSVRFQVPME